MYEDPAKKHSTYVRFSGFQSEREKLQPALKVGCNYLTEDKKSREFYSNSNNPNYFTNEKYNRHNIVTSLNFKNRFVSSHNIDYTKLVPEPKTGTLSIDDLLHLNRKSALETNNLFFLSNIKPFSNQLEGFPGPKTKTNKSSLINKRYQNADAEQQNDHALVERKGCETMDEIRSNSNKADNSLLYSYTAKPYISTMKESYVEIPDSHKARAELPLLFRERRRPIKQLSSLTEYGETIDFPVPFLSKNLVINKLEFEKFDKKSFNCEPKQCYRKGSEREKDNVSSLTENKQEGKGNISQETNYKDLNSYSLIVLGDKSLTGILDRTDNQKLNIKDTEKFIMSNCKIESEDKNDKNPKFFISTNGPGPRSISKNTDPKPTMALRYVYDNEKLSIGTKRSINITSDTTIHVPSSNITKGSDEYLSLDPRKNSKSKIKDFFFTTKKTLPQDNFKLRLPGFGGHVPYDSIVLKQRERSSCLSLDKH